MTYAEIHRLFAAASECETLELYLAEEGGSLPSEFYDSEDGTAPAITAADLLTYIWEHQTLTFHDVFTLSGMRQVDFYVKYDIPRRTVQAWLSCDREAPDYVLKLLLLDVINSKISET